MLRQDALAVDKQFWSTVELLKTTTDRRVRNMWEEDLRDLWNQAQKLVQTNLLDYVTHPKLTLITGRSAEGWITLAKSKNASILESF